MAERSVHEAAVEATATALCERMHFVGGPAVVRPCASCRGYARHQIAALVASVEVREGLVAALSPGRYLWRSPDDDQFASFDRDEMAHAILAALSGTETT